LAHESLVIDSPKLIQNSNKNNSNYVTAFALPELPRTNLFYAEFIVAHTFFCKIGISSNTKEERLEK
jgi:hypothetical protein